MQVVKRVDCVGLKIVLSQNPPFDGYADEAFRALAALVYEVEQGLDQITIATLKRSQDALASLNAPLKEEAE